MDTGPLPDEWCVVCQGKGGWWVPKWVKRTEGRVYHGFTDRDWEVCLFCANGPDDVEETP